MFIEPDVASEPGLGELCAQAIAGGVDVIRLDGASAGPASEVSEVCRREDAIFILAEDPAMAATVHADGIHFGSPDASIGLARAVMGMDAIVGLDVNSPNQARLGLEVGADYLVYGGGTACPGVFASLGGGAGAPLFAGGIAGSDDAASIVGGGVYRLCIGSLLLAGDDVTEGAAAYSRLLGRCI